MSNQQIIETLAAKVMGWDDMEILAWIGWNPLENIHDSWMLVEGFEHYKMQLCLNGQVYCEFLFKGRLYGDHGNTAQEAICKAALKTVT